MYQLSKLSQKALELAIQDGWRETMDNVYRRCKSLNFNNKPGKMSFSHDRKALILLYRDEAKKELLNEGQTNTD